MAVYRINYSQVKNQAHTMSNLSSDLMSVILRLNSMLSLSKQYWDGPAARVYQSRLQNLIFNINATRLKMANVSTTISNVADRIHKEDEETAKRAQALAARLQK